MRPSLVRTCTLTAGVVFLAACTEAAAADWTIRADDACASFQEAAEAATDEVLQGEELDPEAVRSVIEDLTPELASLRDEIRALEVAEGDQEDRDTLLAALEEQVSEWTAAVASPEAAMAQFESQSGAFTDEAGSTADRLGVHGCGTGTTFEESDLTEAERTAAQVTDVTASDYAFAAPVELVAGDHILRFANAGGEDHEMVLVQIAEGTSYDEALQWLEENAESDAEPDFMMGFWGGYAGPDGRTDVAARLGPGTYAMVCFVPAADGEPHFLKGMHHELTVVN